MKRSTKITSIIIIFFLIIVGIIVGREMIGLHFKKKFSKRPPPGVIVKIVNNKNFYKKIETYCTAIPKKTTSFRIRKSELLEKINFNKKVKKGEIIAKLQNENIEAPFDGTIGKRGISENTLGTDNLFIVTLDDSSAIFCDLKIPEIYAAEIKKGLKVEAKFSAYKDKKYFGKIESVASRIDAQTRSILSRATIDNKEFQLLPGSLLEIEIIYAEVNALSVPDTSIIYEGNKKFIYKVLENNIIKKEKIETGIRNQGNLEIISGLFEGDKVVAEGLTKVKPNMKIKPILD